MWEQLKTPILPMVIYGAFELFPPKHNMTLKGKVYCRFLEPIPPDAAATRDEMSLLVRRKMLEAWRDGPEDAGAALGLPQRLEQLFWTIAYFLSLFLLWKVFPLMALKQWLQVDNSGLMGLFVLFSVVITLVFYVYLMYLKFPLAALQQQLFGSAGADVRRK
jgi:hypothetical protein